MTTKLKNFKSAKNYVSKVDEFLASFDQQHPQKSLSQQQEITAYQKLFSQRDNKTKT
jgi:hypothetical protein